MDVYLVGGAVRDELLGLPVHERDWVVVGATPETMRGRGYKPVGRDFPVFLHPDTGEEYALARTERKSGPGHTGFVCHADPSVTLEEDLQRRDLTVNAMARATDGTLIDPWGGQADLAARRLRHVSPAFVEDPLRVLRVARFAARLAPLGFTVADETRTLMRTLSASGELDHLVPERVWRETERALGEADPARYIEVLRDCGALAVLLPEVDRLFGVPQPERWHPEIDTGVHTLMVLTQAARLSDDPVVRFAALVHDVGKGTTPENEWPRHIAHEARGVPLIDALCQRLTVPNAFRDLARLVCRHHLDIHRGRELRPATALRVLEAADALRRPQRLTQCLLACEADWRGHGGQENDAYPQADYWRALQTAVSAVSVDTLAREREAPLPTGPALGRALREARLKAIKTLRDREAA